MRKKCTDSFAKKSLDKFRRMEFLRLEKEKINFFQDIKKQKIIIFYLFITNMERKKLKWKKKLYE